MLSASAEFKMVECKVYVEALVDAVWNCSTEKLSVGALLWRGKAFVMRT